MKNSEYEYIIVADFEKEEEILEKHWNKCCERKIWISLDGTETKFEDLDRKHLVSIIKMLIRFDTKRTHKLLYALIEELECRLVNKGG